MVEKLDTFVLKLLSASKEVGLRRLRSYAASIGGGAEIFREYDKLLQSLDEGSRLPALVVLDGSVPTSKEQIIALSAKARVFLLEDGLGANGSVLPSPDEQAPCWRAEAYLQCSLATFLDSPVVRISMAQVAGPSPMPGSFSFRNLMRWGHAAHSWRLDEERGISESGLRFVKTFNLVSEWRRVTEMFCHFAEARFVALGLLPEAVHFSSDGLLLTGVATCRPADPKAAPGTTERAALLKALSEELRIFRFPISGINQLEDGTLEIAAFHCPVHRLKAGTEPVVLVFDRPKNHQRAKVKTPLEETHDEAIASGEEKKAG